MTHDTMTWRKHYIAFITWTLDWRNTGQKYDIAIHCSDIIYLKIIRKQEVGS